MLPKVAIQKLIWQYQAGKFAGQKAVSFTISVCNPIFLIAKIKYIQFPDYSFCCYFVVIFVGIFKSKKKNCLKS